MEFISIRDFRNATKDAWAALDRDGKVVITNNGKPRAILLGVDSSNFEDMLLSLKRMELTRVIAKMQQQSAENGNDTLTLDDINAEIAAARQNA